MSLTVKSVNQFKIQVSHLLAYVTPPNTTLVKSHTNIIMITRNKPRNTETKRIQIHQSKITSNDLLNPLK